MSGKITVIRDKMIEEQSIHKSDMISISLDELIDRYIRRGLYTDDYYEPPKLTMEELTEIIRRDVEKDIKNGIFQKNMISVI